MSEASFASLGPTLLARKGGAKPAMRPQLAPLPEVVAAEQLEDLGWNDMGQDDDDTAPRAQVVSLAPKAANEDTLRDASPLSKRQQSREDEPVLSGAAMEATDEAAVEGAPAEEALVKAKPAKQAQPARKKKKSAARSASGKRAAFTLRLDAQRHLKLRLASTMKGKSAQAIVTSALDAMFDSIPDLDALAERMKQT